MDMIPAKIITVLAFGVYVFVGGYMAVVWTDAIQAILIAAAVVGCFSILPAIVDMSGFTIATQNGAEAVLNNPDFAFAYMATTVFPPTIGLICLIAGLSAIMSSADSDTIAGVTTFLTDVYALIFKKPVEDEEIPKYSRIILVIMLVGAFCMTIFASDIMGYINNVIGSFTPGMAVALLVGRFWKRATWQGGVATMASGILFGVCYLTIAPFQKWLVGIFAGPALPVTIVTLIVGVIVSLMTPPPVHTEEERVALVIAERNQEKTASIR